LAGVFWLSGGSLLAARFASAFLWMSTAFLTFCLGRRLVGERGALLAAGIVGLSPELLGLTGLLWSENLFVPLFVASLLAIERRRDASAGWLTALGTGLLIGAAVLTRSSAVILIPLLWLTAVVGAAPRAQLGRTLAATLVAVAVIGAWSARNTRLQGRFILVESNMGLNLYLGNSPDTPIPFAWKKWETLPRDARFRALNRGSEGERYTALSRAATDEIKAHPLRTLALAGGKAFDFWLPDFFISRNVRAGSFGPAYRGLSTPVLIVTVTLFLVFIGAALRGAARQPRAFATAFTVATLTLYTLPHMLVYGASRYHTPLMPLIVILAAPELLRVSDGLRRRCRA
jgi:4-amino-4-deoxy-L-arabinose transferase-like glycosyltransferase